jgi:hypothetical protein
MIVALIGRIVALLWMGMAVYRLAIACRQWHYKPYEDNLLVIRDLLFAITTILVTQG